MAVPHNAFVTFAKAKKALKPHDLPLGKTITATKPFVLAKTVDVRMIYYILLLSKEPNVSRAIAMTRLDRCTSSASK